MSITEFDPVEEYSTTINDALAQARESKPFGQIDPPLASEIVEECLENVADISRGDELELINLKASYAAIETACRDIFYDLLVCHCLSLLKL